MPRLADTNILLHFANAADAAHALVFAAVTTLLARGERLHYTHQNRREFWYVCTRPPANNGLGLTVAQTEEWLRRIDATFHRPPDLAAAGPEWDRLVHHYQVHGRAVHDAQIVASMITHGLTQILTINVDDFRRYSEVTAVHPRDVPVPPAPPSGN